MLRKCKKCGREVEGVDLGDNPAWISFDCECGNLWSLSFGPYEE